MQKGKLIALVLLFCTGCYVFHDVKALKNSELIDVKDKRSDENIKKWNLSTNNFFISKAIIQINGPDKKEKFYGSIKFNHPDKYLINLKTIAGIEVARIFITNDTLLVNDRINKIQYFGSADYLIKVLGISNEFLPLVFGDIIGGNIADSSLKNCKMGRVDISGYKKGAKVNYVFDCKRLKSNNTVIKNSLNQNEIKIYYKEFLLKNNNLYPRTIEIRDFKKKININIKINNIERPWVGIIEFIPGSGYEKIPLE